MSPRRVTIPSMRHTCAAGLLVMTVVLTGCGASHGEFVMRRVACSGGRSIRMRIPAWKEKHFEGLEREVAEVSTGTLAGGFTLVTVNGYGRDRFAELHLLIPACDLDRRFGKDGTLAVTFPTGLRLSHPRRPEPNGLAFSFAGPAGVGRISEGRLPRRGGGRRGHSARNARPLVWRGRMGHASLSQLSRPA